jgi:hypothetical protein
MHNTRQMPSTQALPGAQSAVATHRLASVAWRPQELSMADATTTRMRLVHVRGGLRTRGPVIREKA